MIERKTMLGRTAKFANHLILLLVTISCFFPLWYTLVMSLSSKEAVDAGWAVLWPVGFNVKNYEVILEDRVFLGAFIRSVLRVAIGTPLTLLVSVMIAYPLSKSRQVFFARNWIMWLLVFCMLFGGGLVPWYMFMVEYKLIDSLMGLILCGGLPIYYCILIMNTFRSIPRDLEEAALIDGAGPWRTLFSIYLPCAVPTLATISLFVGVNYWNDYFQGMVLSKTSDHYPLMTYIRSFNVSLNMNGNMDTDQLIRATQMSNRSLDAAKVFIALIPMLVVYPWIQKYFISGIMLGAVKE